MNCPSCGAELDMGSRFAHLVVCQFCDSALIKDEKVLRIAGKMAVLAQTPSLLYTGGQGSLEGKRFTVRGRVRYGYEAGYWDEWFLEFDDGTTRWISEDEDCFSSAKVGHIRAES